MRWGRRGGRDGGDAAPEEQPRDVAIRDDSIRLGQFLKLADIVDNGSDARQLLSQGVVTVNGETETRRGRQLVDGDVVDLPDLTHPLGTLVRVVTDR